MTIHSTPSDMGSPYREYNEKLIDLAKERDGFLQFVVGFLTDEYHWKIALAARVFLELEAPESLASFNQQYGETPHQKGSISK